MIISSTEYDGTKVRDGGGGHVSPTTFNLLFITYSYSPAESLNEVDDTDDEDDES